MMDRRRHPRLDTLVLATLRVGDSPHQVVCVDISLGGAFLVTRVRERVGQIVVIELHPPDVTAPQVKLRGQVRHIADGETGRPSGIAVAWIDHDQTALAALLEDLLSTGLAFLQASGRLPDSSSATAG